MIRERKGKLNIQYLRECLDYSPRTGALIWKERPLEHFEKREDHERFNEEMAGTIATKDNGRDNLVVRFMNGRHTFYAQRVIWAMMTFRFPAKTVVHFNHNKMDNRWLNLKLA